jgi:hypothetical protein
MFGTGVVVATESRTNIVISSDDFGGNVFATQLHAAHAFGHAALLQAINVSSASAPSTSRFPQRLRHDSSTHASRHDRRTRHEAFSLHAREAAQHAFAKQLLHSAEDVTTAPH